jgi:glycosyltransferase involved in cell wall biosynthesis
MSVRISIVIPVYDMRTYLPEAIESALAQTLPADATEIVVVDDGSRDGSGDVAARYAPRVRVVRQENRGLPAARNAGIRATTAPFLTFLDADDRLLPEKLAAEIALFDAQPELGVVYSGVRHVDDAGRPLPQRGFAREEGRVLGPLVLGNLIHPNAAMVRRSLVEQAGGFDERLTSVEDWDLWLRIARLGAPWGRVDRVLSEYRVRHDGMHQNAQRMLDNRLRVLARVFADPGLPAEVVALRGEAYRNTYLAAACDWYRVGDDVRGADAFRAAASSHPASLSDPRLLKTAAAWLLPDGGRNDALVAAQWPRVSATLRRMLRQLFATPELRPAVARRRTSAWVAYGRLATRYARKRLAARLTRTAAS